MPTKPKTQNEALRAVYNHPSLPAELHDICREALVAAYNPATTERAATQPAGEVTWLPTPASINALPLPVRKYIHDLAARCDPAGDVAALTLMQDQCDGLQVMYRNAADALVEVEGCFSAAEVEGLGMALAETTDERLKDLVERRLMHALYAVQNLAAPISEDSGKGDVEKRDPNQVQTIRERLTQAPAAPSVTEGDALPPLQRYGWTTAYIGETSDLVEDDNGNFVRYAEVVDFIAAARAALPTTGGEVMRDALTVIRDIDKIGMEFAARLARIGIKFTKGERDFLLRDDVMREVVGWRHEWNANSAARPDFAAMLRATHRPEPAQPDSGEGAG